MSQKVQLKKWKTLTANDLTVEDYVAIKNYKNLSHTEIGIIFEVKKPLEKANEIVYRVLTNLINGQPIQ